MEGRKEEELGTVAPGVFSSSPGTPGHILVPGQPRAISAAKKLTPEEERAARSARAKKASLAAKEAKAKKLAELKKAEAARRAAEVRRQKVERSKADIKHLMAVRDALDRAKDKTWGLTHQTGEVVRDNIEREKEDLTVRILDLVKDIIGYREEKV
jgi:hypothetical protein